MKMKLEDILKKKKKMYIVGEDDDDHNFDILIVLTTVESCWIKGHAFSWAGGGGGDMPKDIYLQYISEFQIGWDACSHFYFTGEDSLIQEEPDQYYHVCGIYCYSVMIDTYLALIQIAKSLFTQPHQLENFVSPYTEALLEVFNKNSHIKEIDGSEFSFYEWNGM